MVSLMHIWRGACCLEAVWVLVSFVTGGCSSKPSVGIGTVESRAQVASHVRDRDRELTALRAEMAATRIAAAKKEAELVELRDLVQQLRIESAESRQAYLEIREQVEQRQIEQTKERDAQEKTVQSQATQHLTALKDTVVTLVQEVGQLREDMSKSSGKVPVKPSMMSSEASIAPTAQNVRSEQPRQTPSAAKTPESPSMVVPRILMMQQGSDETQASSVTVQLGETLWGLAKRHRTSISTLQTLNGLKGGGLLVGQVLKLPSRTQP